MTMITLSINSLQHILTCLKGQSVWAVASPCLAKKKTPSMQDKFNNLFRSDLLSGLPPVLVRSCVSLRMSVS